MPQVPSCTDSGLPEIHNLELLLTDGTTILVDRAVLRIGASEICEIQLANGPMLHSVLRYEEGIVWIEADDPKAELLVNDRICRRMALREGDIITFSGVEMKLRYRCVGVSEQLTGQDTDSMSAEELCDRIVEEQSAVERFESACRRGWQNLIAAVLSAHKSEKLQFEMSMIGDDNVDEECARILDQIHEMSEIITGRSLELDEAEAELVAATELLHETQDHVSRQIEELLEQMPQQTELRASA